MTSLDCSVGLFCIAVPFRSFTFQLEAMKAGGGVIGLVRACDVTSSVGISKGRRLCRNVMSFVLKEGGCVVNFQPSVIYTDKYTGKNNSFKVCDLITAWYKNGKVRHFWLNV